VVWRFFPSQRTRRGHLSYKSEMVAPSLSIAALCHCSNFQGVVRDCVGRASGVNERPVRLAERSCVSDNYVVDSRVVHFVRQHDAAQESKMQAALHAGLTE
jgi:hypothetical protein